MQLPKYIPYLLAGIFIVGLASLYLLIMNKKDVKEQSNTLNDQSTLLVAMAQKLMGEEPIVEESENKSVKQTISKTEEEQEKIVIIADKICFNKPLDAEETELKNKFSADIKKESEKSKSILASIIDKFLTGSKDFDQSEQDFYQDNQQDIDTIVQDKKLFASVIEKLTSGKNEFTDAELEYQQNNPKTIETELARIKKESEKFHGANPPDAPDKRLKIILSLFDDGIPKTVTELSKLYAEKTATKADKSNFGKILGKVVTDGFLVCQQAQRGAKVYHGLHGWFEKDKLKPEYQQKINKS